MATNIHEKNVGILKNILKLAGVSLKQNETLWYKIYSPILLCGILSLPIYGSHTMITQLNARDYDGLIETLMYNSAFLLTFFKVAAAFLTRKKIGAALERLQSGVFVLKRAGEDEDEKLLISCVRYMTGQTACLCVLTLLNSFSASVGTLIHRITYSDCSQWRLPFGEVLLFDATDSPNYDIVWIYQTIFVPIACLAFCATDAFIAGTMAYLSVQCKILQKFIKKSVVYSHQQMLKDIQPGDQSPLPFAPSEVSWKYLKLTLREIIEYHTYIIDIAGEFERLFNIQILIEFLGLSIVICLAMFYATGLSEVNFRFIQQLTLALGGTFVQLITAYWSNEVMKESTAISQACCEVDSSGVDVRFQKGLLMIIQRSHKPIQFTVGRFAPLSLNTFLAVLKAAYSYYNMLLHGRNKGYK